MISIVIPLYNKEKQISNTLQTVFNQTYQEFEIIIVNDGSTDNSVDEVLKIKDSRIRLFHQANAGVSSARNKGISESKFDLIAFLDADDTWKPEYLQTQFELYQKYTECDIYACNYEIKDNKGKITPTIIHKLLFNETDGILTNYFEVASCSHPPLWTSAVVVKKDAILSVAGFPPGIKAGEDLLTWAKLADAYKIAYYSKPLATFNAPTFVTDREKRLDVNKKDIVHDELYHLFVQTKNDKKNIKKYIGRWNEMRTAIFLESGLGMESLKPAWRALRYTGFTAKTIFFILVSFLPGNGQKYIMKYKRNKQ